MLEVTTRSGTNGFASRLVGETRAEVCGEFAGNCVGKIHEMKERRKHIPSDCFAANSKTWVACAKKTVWHRMKQDRGQGTNNFFIFRILCQSMACSKSWLCSLSYNSRYIDVDKRSVGKAMLHKPLTKKGRAQTPNFSKMFVNTECFQSEHWIFQPSW